MDQLLLLVPLPYFTLPVIYSHWNTIQTTVQQGHSLTQCSVLHKECMSTPDDCGRPQHLLSQHSTHTHTVCVQMCVLSLLPMSVLASHLSGLHLLTCGVSIHYSALAFRKKMPNVLKPTGGKWLFNYRYCVAYCVHSSRPLEFVSRREH